MKTLSLFSLLLFALMTMYFSSCGSGKREIIVVDSAFNEYVSAYSSGMQSRKDHIRVQLQDVLKPETLEALKREDGFPKKALTKGLFTFEPEISGKAIWVDNYTIDFIPDEALPTSQLYDVHFNLAELVDVKNGFEDFHFQFATYKQELFVEISGLYSENDYDLTNRYLEGTIRTADYEDTTLLRKTLRVTLDGKEMPYSLTESYEEKQYRFRVDGIQRQNEEKKIVVTWNGKAIRASSTGRLEEIVPALGDFSVSNSVVRDEEDQYVELTFSEPITGSQNLNGLITIDGIDDLSFSTDGNLVTIWLPNRIVGKHKLQVSEGLKNCQGHGMLKSFSTDLDFKKPSPMVRIKGNGSILPNSQGLIFPFEAISLKSVDVRVIKIFENNIHHFLQVNTLSEGDNLSRFGKKIAEKKIHLDYDKNKNLKEWNTFIINLDQLIHPDPGAIYRVSIKFSREDAICDCPPVEEEPVSESDEYYEEERDPNWNEDEWNSYAFNDEYEDWYYYDGEESPCADDYYYGRAVSRNILASDLGTIFKLDEDHFSHTFVTDMLTAEPVPGAEVTFYDYTKQIIAQGHTDGNGMLDVRLKEKPFLMITKRGKQRGYMKLGDGYSNSLSEFDIEGEELQNGVKGFIYGERGVWRPGDSLYLTFILQDLEDKLPENHPVKFELYDPNGALVTEMTRVKHLNGMYDFRTATTSEAPTGYYTAYVKVGNRTFSRNLKVETVKPNRLKIYMNLDERLLRDSSLMVVKWLHGAPARNLQTEVSVKVNQTETAFKGYEGYCFDSPIRSCHTDMELIHTDTLNSKGEAWINTRLDVGDKAPGMLRAHYITRVYEPGGDFSIDRYSVNYSPFKTYIGIRKPKTAQTDGSLETDQWHKFEVAAVNEDGKPDSAENVRVKIFKMQWRWWYEQDDEDLSDFIGRTGTILVKDTLLSLKSGKSSFRFRVNHPEYGRYLILADDETGHHQTGEIITIDYPYLQRGNRRDNERANMLSFSCDKESYTAGESIRLAFPSPSNGKALVSVETSKRVVKKFWINTVKGETVHSFEATADMSPNAFIHVTMIQPHASTQNDLPIRMYGIAPIRVDDPKTHLHPEIAMADVVRPETTVPIKIHEQNGRKMTYTLEIVDDGLLDLTAFKTPDPWTTFYAKEPLGVTTWDIYDEVIGAYAGKIEKLLSVGGDGDLDGAKGPKANRFKPVVLHLGPFELDPGQTKTHSVTIPNYMGSVRVMVVAQQDGAYGNTQKTVTVKKPLMVLATLPRVLGPGETVQLPVNVFAMEKHIKDVQVSVEINDFLVLKGGTSQSVHFDDIGDKVLNFQLNVAEKVGIARVKVIAVCGKEKAVEEIELDVRPANPITYEGQEVVLQPGKSWDTELLFKGLEGTNKATIEFSTVPAIGLEKRLDYLITYPHGCIEQTTSGAFPQLYVDKLIDLSKERQTTVSNNVKVALKRLQLFQTANGGFAYWPGESAENEWGTNYAGHFMLEAEQQGYHLPENLKTRWLDFQSETAKNFDPSSSDGKDPSRQLTQAYRLYVLALGGKAEMGAMNRLRETMHLSAVAKWRLAAAYQLVGQKEVASQLISQLPLNVSKYRELSGSYGSDVRDQSMILETLVLTGKTGKATETAQKIANKLKSDEWLSTQETAYALLAMSSYAGVKKGGGGSFSCQLNGGTAQKPVSAKTIQQIVYTEQTFKKHAQWRCKNTGNAPLYVKVIVQGVPLRGDKNTSSSNLKMSVVFKDANGKIMRPDKLKQGTDFTAEVTITNPGKKGVYREMALTQIFPSGWEIHNDRMDGGGSTSAARYQDICDDRVYTYYDLAPKESKTFKIHLNATYLGRFYLPATYTDAMYDHLINARAPGKWVEVVKQT